MLDSSYEAFVWGALKIAKVPVERFDRRHAVEWSPGHWYAPDLWLPMQQLAIECKGIIDDDDPARWDAYRTAGRRLLVLDQEALTSLSPFRLSLVIAADCSRDHPERIRLDAEYRSLGVHELGEKTKRLLEIYEIDTAYEKLCSY